MKHLNDLANHIKEITNNVSCVNFDKIYSYKYQQMVVYSFGKIFQDIINADPSSTFALSCYINLDYYEEYYHNFPVALKHIKFTEITANPFIDLLVLCEITRDRLVTSFTAKGSSYW